MGPDPERVIEYFLFVCYVCVYARERVREREEKEVDIQMDIQTDRQTDRHDMFNMKIFKYFIWMNLSLADACVLGPQGCTRGSSPTTIPRTLQLSC